jgi:hypothetical protein
MMRACALVTAAILVGILAALPRDPQSAGSRYLFAWAADADKQESDFLAVIDVDPRSPTYASVVSTVPVGAKGTVPHHTNYEMPADGMLWANGFASGQTFRFDLRDPRQPHLLAMFGDVGAYSHPHSYARLANGHVLATFQHHVADGRVETGGIAEMDAEGRLLRSAPAAVPAIDPGIRPYSLLVLPSIDRIISTASDMHLETHSSAIQFWRLSDLKLLKTILLPPGSRGNENTMTAEPRLLADGKTVLVNTFTCGLYRLEGIAGEDPLANWIYSTPWTERPYCAVPIVAGRYWLQPSGPEHAVISLDVSDPGHPREVARLTLAPHEIPHWLGLEPGGDRIVITGYEQLESRLLLATLDRTTGAIRLDPTFKARDAGQPGVDFNREQWPHGHSGRAIPHGAVFSRP